MILIGIPSNNNDQTLFSLPIILKIKICSEMLIVFGGHEISKTIG